MALRHHGPLIAAGVALVVGLVALALLVRADSGPRSSLVVTATPDVYATLPPLTATLAPTPAPPAGTVTLMPVSRPTGGEIMLSWTTTATDVASWEYRLSGAHCKGDTGWTAIPSSGASTESHILSGLIEDAAYCMQIRARTAADATLASDIVMGRALLIEADAIPRMGTGAIVEGGHAYRVGGTDFVIDVPAGMLLKLGGVAWTNGPNEFTVTLLDIPSRSYILMDAETGEWLDRSIVTQPQDGATGQTRDVNALFDQIVASSRRRPAP